MRFEKFKYLGPTLWYSDSGYSFHISFNPQLCPYRDFSTQTLYDENTGLPMTHHDISEAVRNRQLWQYNYLGSNSRTGKNAIDKWAVFQTLRFSVYLFWTEWWPEFSKHTNSAILANHISHTTKDLKKK